MEPRPIKSCCATSSLIDCFRVCLCLRTPNYDALSKTKQKQIDQQMANEIYALNRLYATPKPLPTYKSALQPSSFPRIPLAQRTISDRSGSSVAREKKTSGEARVRPITQLVGISRSRSRRHRSVTRWAEQRRESGAFRQGRAE